MFRGGVGRYYDFAYTNANILFAVIGAQSSFGQIYSHTNSSGIRNADGSLFQVGPAAARQPARHRDRRRCPAHAASPVIKQPYTDQANLGFAKALGGGWAIEIDGVYAHGKDLGLRPRLNTRTNGGTSPRRLTGRVPANIAAANFRIDISEGISHYKGVSLALKKQWDGKLQLMGSYTLSESTSNTSLRATDEFGEYDVRSTRWTRSRDNQENPTRTDNRHRVTISGVWSPGWDLAHRAGVPLQVGRSRSTSSPASTPTATASSATCRRASRRSTAAAARPSCSSTCASRSASARRRTGPSS